MQRAAVTKVLCAALAAAPLLAASACGGGPKRFDEIRSTPHVSNPAMRLCNQPSFASIDASRAETNLPDAKPYPTPTGEFVQPGITGIPLPPDAKEIESFRQTFNGQGSVVQVFETDYSTDELFDFYDQEMSGAGWLAGGLSRGSDGMSCEYVPERSLYSSGQPPRYWVRITTVYFPQAGDGASPEEPPPGFRGKGFPFAPRNPEKTTFSVISPR